MPRFWTGPGALLSALSTLAAGIFGSAAVARGQEAAVSGGELRILGREGETAVCPLKTTSVECDITGFVARTTVRQVFHNPTNGKIEAIYVFPLPANAAVDDMVMTVGGRRIIGQIKPREEAREIYERAREAGHVASLLDQERPNIFTQSVTNIEPGAEVTIEISFVETLKYEDGLFEWVFPMVVGPRYIPGGGSAPAPGATGKPTPQVPDADRITPPVAGKGMRAGHDIQITVRVDAGMPLFDLASELHDIEAVADGDHRATVTLRNKAEIPNRDFILRYRLASEQISDAFLTYSDPRGTFFTLILQPPQRVMPDQVVNREVVFVLDTSGSMQGFPIEKAREVMAKAIAALQPGDTFNLITFSGDTHILWEKPRPATTQNVAEAQKFLAERQGRGGTEMMKAIDAALVQHRDQPGALSPAALADLPADGREVLLRVPYESWSDPDGGEFLSVRVRDGVVIRVTPKRDAIPWIRQGGWCPTGEPIFIRGHWRTVRGERILEATAQMHQPAGPSAIRVAVFMTDGYVGNDMEIIDAVRRNAGTTRVFSFGIGNSVNRFLLDGMAAAGRGEVEYVTLQGQADAAVQRLHERILAPVLTDISIDWNLPVADVLPTLIPDLWSVKPIMIHGRLTGPAHGTIILRGNTGAGGFERQINVNPASAAPQTADHSGRAALASLWARARVDELMLEDLLNVQRGTTPEARKQQITELGVTYRLMTQFTSFVAVEELTVTVGGQPQKINVPVEMPEGVSHEGVFGDAGGFAPMAAGKAAARGRMALGGVAGRPAAPPPAAPALGAAPRELAERTRGKPTAGLELRRAADARDEDDGGWRADAPAATPESKLSGPLAGLAEKVEKDGRDGDLTVGSIRVTKYQVDVMVYLRDVSDATRTELEKLGFTLTAESNAARLLIGTIDVRKLLDLAKLDVVIRITAVTP